MLDFIRHSSGQDARAWLDRHGLSKRGYSPLRAMAVSKKVDLGAEPRDLTDEEKARALAAKVIFERAQPMTACRRLPAILPPADG